jgi:hypothetical protein
MKNAMNWAQYIAVQVVFFACLYAWKVDHIEGAGNVLQSLLWVLAFAGIALGLWDPRGEIQPHSHLREIVGISNTAALLTILTWYGHFILVIFYALGLLGAKVYRDQFGADGKPLPVATPAHAES